MYDSHGNTAAVQATNDDASASKLSCVKKGYMKDDYIPHISVRKPFRRSPFINLRIERMELFDEFEEWYMMQGLFGEFGFVNNNKTRLPSS